MFPLHASGGEKLLATLDWPCRVYQHEPLENGQPTATQRRPQAKSAAIADSRSLGLAEKGVGSDGRGRGVDHLQRVEQGLAASPEGEIIEPMRQRRRNG